MKHFKSIVFLLFFNISYLPAQIVKEWSVIHYPLNNPQNYSVTDRDQMRFLSNGDIITGWRFNFSGGNSAIGTTSYSQNGNLNWERFYAGAFLDDGTILTLEIDSADNIYTLGVVNDQTAYSDNAIIKYDSNGNQIWVAEDDSINTEGQSSLLIEDKYYLQSMFHPSLYRFDLNGILVDSIYVDSVSPGVLATELPVIVNRGRDIYYASSFSVFAPLSIMLYASKAVNCDSVVWKSTVDASQDYEMIEDAVVDQDGNLFMTAQAGLPSTTDRFIFTCGFDSDTGDTLWTNKKLAIPGSPAFTSDIDVDNAGYVYVAGSIVNPNTNRAEAILIQYDAVTGQEKWSVTMDSSYFYFLDFVKISIDTITKDIYFAYSTLPVSGFSSTSIAKIDSSGNVIWRGLFPLVGSAESFVYDQNGHLYIAGGSLMSKFSLTTGVDESLKISNLYLNPNPANNYFTIAGNYTTINRVVVSNITGQIIYESNDSNIALGITCNQWPSGLYFVKIYFDNSQRQTLKLIRN